MYSLISVPKTQAELVVNWKDDQKLGVLIREQKTELVNIVCNEIFTFISVISAPTNITKDNVFIVAERFLAIDEVVHLSITELKFFFKKAFELKYGKIYGSFGLDTLITWFNDFLKDREAEFEYQSRAKHDEFTSHEKQTRSKPPTFGNDPMSIGDYL